MSLHYFKAFEAESAEDLENKMNEWIVDSDLVETRVSERQDQTNSTRSSLQ